MSERIEIIAYPPRQRSINDLLCSSWRYCAWGWQSQWVEVDINKLIHFTANGISGPFYSSWVLVYPCIMLFVCQIVIRHALFECHWHFLAVYFDSLCDYLQSKVKCFPFSVFYFCSDSSVFIIFIVQGIWGQLLKGQFTWNENSVIYWPSFNSKKSIICLRFWPLQHCFRPHFLLCIHKNRHH